MDPSLLFVTNGISGALGLVCSLYAGRGDVVVVEEPSYFLALSIFRDFGLTIVPIGIDGDGMRTGELEQKLASGLRPKLVYTIPSFQNPTGVVLSAARKAHLVALAHKYDFVVLADEVYQLLAFDNIPPPPPVLAYYEDGSEAAAGATAANGHGAAAAALAPGAGRVISMGSFAKILAPALRLGWLQVAPAGKHLLDRIYNCGQLDSSGGLNPVVSGIVHAFIDGGHQEAHVRVVRAELTSRATILGAALRAHLPRGASFEAPTGGYFVWIGLPPGLRGGALLDLALSEGFRVKFHPGTRFGGPAMDAFIRLSFSYYSADDLAVGAQRVCAAMVRLGERVAGSLALPMPSAGSSSSGAAAAAATSSVPGGLVIGVQGSRGRLGALIVSTLAAAAPSGVVDGAHKPLVYGGPIDTRTTALADDTDVVIDVSLPEGTATLVAALLARAKAPSSGARRAPALVVGTTGALPLDALSAYAALAPVVLSANFSVGVPLVLGMLGGGALKSLPAGWHAEVTEIHHTAKKDAPSGTAKRLVHALSAGGVGGAEPSAPIPVHALRLGDAVGVHTVYLAGPGERVEVTHTATRRDVFALGALRTAAWAASQPPGLYYK